MKIARKLQLSYKDASFLTIIFIISYSIVAIIVSLNRFWQYQDFYFDFGVFDMAIWKVSQFQLPFIDHIDLGIQNKIIFADHFNPSIFLISPLYWFTNRSEMLLIVQSLTVGLSAFVAYLIAIKKLRSKLLVFSLIFSYLGYVGLQNALISDFHEATISVLPLILIFWSIYNQKWKIYFILLIVLLGLKETFAGLGICLGIYLLIRYPKLKRYGLATILVSLVWGFLVIRYLIPYFSGGIYLYLIQQPLNLTFDSLYQSLFIPPIKMKTVFYSFASFGFLPILDLAILPSILENFFERFILSSYKGQDLGLHYNATLSPLLFIGELYILSLLEKSKKLSKALTIYGLSTILLVLFLHKTLHGPLALAYNRVFYEQNKNVTYVDYFVSNFPKQGTIMTQNDLAVRLTHQSVKLLRYEYTKINPDYVILNLTPGQNPNSFFPLNYDQTNDLKNRLLNDKNYKLKKFANDQYLFSKINL